MQRRVAAHRVEVVPLHARRVRGHVRGADHHRVADVLAAGSGQRRVEQVELRVQHAAAAAAEVAAVREGAAHAGGVGDLRAEVVLEVADRLGCDRTEVVVHQDLHADAAAGRGDQRPGERHVGRGVQRDPDRGGVDLRVAGRLRRHLVARHRVDRADHVGQVAALRDQRAGRVVEGRAGRHRVVVGGEDRAQRGDQRAVHDLPGVVRGLRADERAEDRAHGEDVAAALEVRVRRGAGHPAGAGAEDVGAARAGDPALEGRGRVVGVEGERAVHRGVRGRRRRVRRAGVHRGGRRDRRRGRRVGPGHRGDGGGAEQHPEQDQQTKQRTHQRTPEDEPGRTPAAASRS